MSTIARYVLIDKAGLEDDREYHDYQAAVDAAGTDNAVIERTYTFSDSELVWTPNGERTWPPHPQFRRKPEAPYAP